MPLSPTYTWRQTATHVLIDVALHGFEVDVFVSPQFVKVSDAPYLLTLDLFARVADERAKVTLDRAARRIAIELPKEGAAPPPAAAPAAPAPQPPPPSASWDALTCRDASDKAAVAARRAASVAERTARDAKAASGHVAARGEQARASVRAQMDVEDRSRRLLEGVQAEQKREAEREVFEALAELQRPAPAPAPAPAPKTNASKAPAAAAMAAPAASSPSASSSSSSLSSSPAPAAAPAKAAAARPVAAAASSSLAPQPALASTSSSAASSSAAAAAAALDEPAPLPPPRRAPPVKVTFTARAFPTPLRESRKLEEENWLARNYVKLAQSAAQRKLAGDPGGPATPFTEKDAAWLKSKGDDFFRHGDFGSALNAYSAALASDAGSLPCLLNRAACFLQRRMPAQCAADCSAALALLPPPGSGAADEPVPAALAAAAPQQRAQVLRALARRAAALALEGKFAAALVDARRAAQLDADAALARVAARLAVLARASAVKEEGDAAAAASRSDVALARYAFALELEPRYALAMLNRSALTMRLERFAECARDCEAVLRLLEEGERGGGRSGGGGDGATRAAEGEGEDEGEGDDEGEAAGGVAAVPVKGSPLHAQVEQRARARLAECRRHLGLPSAEGEGAMGETVTAMSTS